MLSTGIIPAHAGSRTRTAPIPSRSWDHPRACGEQYWQVNRPGMGQGSSPRMRGAAMYHPVGNGEVGIIPAHAGSSHA